MKSRKIMGVLAVLVIALFMLGSTRSQMNSVQPDEVTIPIPIAPVGNENDRTPVYTWTNEPAATQYQIQVKQGGTVIFYGTVDTSVCEITECAYEPPLLLDYGSYVWRVRALVSGSWEPMSTYQWFTVIKPVLKQPLGGIFDSTPSYVWLKEVDATRYQLRLQQGTSTIYTRIVTPSSCGPTNCRYTPTDVLPLGDYQWRVSVEVEGVWGDWTTGHNFRVNQDPSFVSDFNSNMDGWGVVEGDWWIAGSRVLKTEGATMKLSSVYYQESNFANLRYIVKMKRAAAGCSGCANGIIIRGGITPLTTDSYWHHEYLFVYSNLGTVAVYRIDNGTTFVTLHPVTASPAVVPNGWNTLRVDAIGGSLKFYVNNQLVYSKIDTTYSIGKIGIAMYRDSTEGNLFFVDWASASYRNPIAFLPIMDGKEMEPEKMDLEGGIPLMVP